jgi:hypothetical protein
VEAKDCLLAKGPNTTLSKFRIDHCQIPKVAHYNMNVSTLCQNVALDQNPTLRVTPTEISIPAYRYAMPRPMHDDPTIDNNPIAPYGARISAHR